MNEAEKDLEKSEQTPTDAAASGRPLHHVPNMKEVWFFSQRFSITSITLLQSLELRASTVKYILVYTSVISSSAYYTQINPNPSPNSFP